jgi:hypothetical protein
VFGGHEPLRVSHGSWHLPTQAGSAIHAGRAVDYLNLCPTIPLCESMY